MNAENQLEQRVPAPFHSDHESLACPLHGKVHDRFIRSGDEFITETALQERKARIFPKGSVLVAMIGQGKTRGSTALMEIDTCVNQNFACITPREVESRYLFFALDFSYERLRRSSNGSNQEPELCFSIQVPDSFRCAESAMRNRGLLVRMRGSPGCNRTPRVSRTQTPRGAYRRGFLTMSFNESNTVEQMILNAVENLGRTTV